jgi:hypothetical protein
MSFPAFTAEPIVAAGRRVRLARYEVLAVGVPILIYAALVTGLTWPFLAHPTMTLTAPIGFDVNGSIAKYHALAVEHAVPFTRGVFETIGYPGGVPKTPALDIASALSTTPLWLGSLTIGAVATHGLQSVLGLFLTATVTFLFVRRITGSTCAAFVAGLAYGFFPHITLLARAAPGYTHMWLYVLPIWALTELVVTPTRRRALFAGLSPLPAMYWTPYFTAHILVLTVACGLAAVLLMAWRRQAAIARLAGWFALPVVAGAAVYALIGVVSGGGQVPARDALDAYNQSSHPIMYVIPGFFSTYGDFSLWQETGWGKPLNEFLVARVPRAYGTDLYLGWSVLLLAAVGLIWTIRRLRRPAASACRAVEERTMIGGVLAFTAAFAAFACSGPPTVSVERLGITFPTPSYLIVHAVPALRAGQRFVMPMMAGVAILAGIGLAALILRRHVAIQLAVTAVVASIVAVDLWARAPESVVQIPHSTALATLREQPDGPAIHYLPEGLLTGRITAPCLWQIQHGKTLVNPCSTTFFPAMLFQLNDYKDCANLVRLREIGVRYVVSDGTAPMFPGCPGRARELDLLAQDEFFRVERLREMR